MKKILVIAAVTCAAVLALSACDDTDWGTSQGQAAENHNARAGQLALETSQPAPVFGYSQYRQSMIEIETIEAKGIQSTSFIFGAANDPDPVKTCPSIGLPIPSTASLTNPQQSIDNPGQGNVAVGQMDPNGVYMPSAGSGTFVMCIQGDGSVELTYAEGNVQTEMGPAIWDYTTHRIQPTGPASFHFSKSQGN